MYHKRLILIKSNMPRPYAMKYQILVNVNGFFHKSYVISFNKKYFSYLNSFNTS